jgi:putative copper resistance protein D
MKRWSYRLCVLLLAIVSSTGISKIQAQAPVHHQNGSTEASVATAHPDRHASGLAEGSPGETDFSEFHHHVAGFFIVVFGLAELGHALKYPLPLWTRFILPGALSVIGVLVLFGDAHSAWPIGSIDFVNAFFGQDREMMEHKLYGVLALTVAFFETLRRSGRGWQAVSAAPLVMLTLAGSLWLFAHSHGEHPALGKIQFQHSLLGIVGIGAALSKGLASWLPSASPQVTKRWEVAWAGSEILLGVLLLVYSQ